METNKKYEQLGRQFSELGDRKGEQAKVEWQAYVYTILSSMFVSFFARKVFDGDTSFLMSENGVILSSGALYFTTQVLNKFKNWKYLKKIIELKEKEVKRLTDELLKEQVAKINRAYSNKYK